MSASGGVSLFPPASAGTTRSAWVPAPTPHSPSGLWEWIAELEVALGQKRPETIVARTDESNILSPMRAPAAGYQYAV